MRFRPSQSPPSYFNRRVQYRLLGMVFVLSLVLIAMQIAADPRMWYWLTGPPQPDAQPQTAPLTLSESGENGGTIPSSGTDEETSQPENSELVNSRTDTESNSKAQGPEDAAPQPEKSSQGSLQATGELIDQSSRGEVDLKVDRRLLETIDDHRVGLRRSESEAYYSILAQARDFPVSQLQAAARDDLAFAVLMAESDRYRGELVTITGTVKRLWKLPASSNSYQVGPVYEAWMLTPDSGSEPWVVRCIDIPEGIPQGEDVSFPAQVTGYFFKRYTYEAVQGLHTAPMLLAKRIDWLRPMVQETKQDDRGVIPYLVAFFTLILAGLAFMLWQFSAEKRIDRRNLGSSVPESQESLADLNGLPTADVSEMFQAMTEQADTGSDPARDR